MAVMGAILLYAAYFLPVGFATFFVQSCRLLVLMNLMLVFIHLIPMPPFDLGRILFDRNQSLGEDWIRKGLLVNRRPKLTPNRRAILTPLSGTAEVVPVVNRGDPSGFV